MKRPTAQQKADERQFINDYPNCEAAIKQAHKNIHQPFSKDSWGDVKQLKTEFLMLNGLNASDYNVEITCENGFDKSSPNKFICRNHAHYKAVPKITPQLQKLQDEKEELIAKVAALEADLAWTQSRNKKLEKRDTQLQIAFSRIYREAENIAEIFCCNEAETQSFGIN